MDRDEFIITVYCLVCEHYQVIKKAYSVRRGGFAPALSDEEVVTMEICGEYFKLATDKDLFGYFRTHYGTSFRSCGTGPCSCGKRPTCGGSKR